MVRRRSTVRFRNGALAHTLGKRRPTWADQVRCRLCDLRLATAETGSLRLVVPNTCPSLSRAPWVRYADGSRVRPGLLARPRCTAWQGGPGRRCAGRRSSTGRSRCDQSLGDMWCTSPVRNICTSSRRPAGPLAPPTRRARRCSRWRSRSGGAWRRSAGAKAKRFTGRQRHTAVPRVQLADRLAGFGSHREQVCSRTLYCPARPEPVKSAYGVGSADLRLLTEPARSLGSS